MIEPKFFFSHPPIIDGPIFFFSEMENNEYVWNAEDLLLEEPRLTEFFPSDHYHLGLEVGAGNGRCTAPLSRICDTLVALESSRKGICQLLSRRLQNIVPVLSYDLMLPFNSNIFDFVASVTVIEHIPAANSKAFLEEHFRVLRPGGIFLIRNDAWAYGVYEKFIGYRGRDADPSHINMITPRRLKAQLLDIGFEIISEAYFPFYRYTKRKLPLFDLFATKGNFICRKPDVIS